MTKFNNHIARRKEMSHYTYDDFKKFISFAQNLKTKTIFEILYYCGLRQRELKVLTWKDIYFDKTISLVNKRLTQLNDKGKIEFSDAKTKDSKHIVPIIKFFLNDLKELYEHDKKIYANFYDDFFVYSNCRPIADIYIVLTWLIRMY